MAATKNPGAGARAALKVLAKRLAEMTPEERAAYHARVADIRWGPPGSKARKKHSRLLKDVWAAARRGAAQEKTEGAA